MENNTVEVVLVKDINPGLSVYGFADNSSPSDLTVFEDKLFFSANDGSNGNELFVSDGTTEGTQLLLDINPGLGNYSSASFPSDLTVFEDRLFFSADDGINGSELWVSNGTAEGTQLLVDLNPEGSVYAFAASTDPSYFTVFEERLFFSADNGESGVELFVSDGTAEGTQILADLNPSFSYGFADNSFPSDFVVLEDKLFFSANDGENGNELWVSDGTAKGTQLLVDLNYNSEGGSIYGSYPRNLTAFEEQIFFSADNGASGVELFVSDGTAEGTQLLLDINPGFSEEFDFTYGSFPSDFVVFKDKLFFSANDGENGTELWVSDGTAEGTQLLVDLNPGFSNGDADGSDPSGFVVFEDKLFFSANDGENGTELWVSDGSAKGTQLLVDINPDVDSYGSEYGSDPSNLTVFNNELFFSADNGESGQELFKLTFDEASMVTSTRDADDLDGGDGSDVLVLEFDQG